MSKKATFSDEEITKNIETMHAIAGVIIDIILNAKYMEDEPNDNSLYLHALSIQSMGLVNLVFLLLDDTEAKRSEVKNLETVIARAMFLRSLIEAAANIHLFATHKDNDELAKKFLRTASIADEALRSIRNHKPFKRYYWTNKSIAKRIDDLEASSKHLGYSSLYFYLSSFVHSDAGFLTALPRTKSRFYPHLFYAMSVLCMMDILDDLERAGALNDSSSQLIKGLKDYLDSKSKNNQQ